jgi:hypothetical protein
MRSKNAYLLFYDRVTPYRVDGKGKEFKVGKSADVMNIFSPEKQRIYIEEFHRDILEENIKFNRHRNIFSHEYFKFMSGLLNERRFEPNEESLENPFRYSPSDRKKFYDLELLKLGLVFLLTAVMREKDQTELISVFPAVKRALSEVS